MSSIIFPPSGLIGTQTGTGTGLPVAGDWDVQGDINLVSGGDLNFLGGGSIVGAAFTIGAVLNVDDGLILNDDNTAEDTTIKIRHPINGDCDILFSDVNDRLEVNKNMVIDGVDVGVLSSSVGTNATNITGKLDNSHATATNTHGVSLVLGSSEIQNVSNKNFLDSVVSDGDLILNNNNSNSDVLFTMGHGTHTDAEIKFSNNDDRLEVNKNMVINSVDIGALSSNVDTNTTNIGSSGGGASLPDSSYIWGDPQTIVPNMPPASGIIEPLQDLTGLTNLINFKTTIRLNDTTGIADDNSLNPFKSLAFFNHKIDRDSGDKFYIEVKAHAPPIAGDSVCSEWVFPLGIQDKDMMIDSGFYDAPLNTNRGRLMSSGLGPHGVWLSTSNQVNKFSAITGSNDKQDQIFTNIVSGNYDRMSSDLAHFGISIDLTAKIARMYFYNQNAQLLMEYSLDVDLGLDWLDHINYTTQNTPGDLYVFHNGSRRNLSFGTLHSDIQILTESESSWNTAAGRVGKHSSLSGYTYLGQSSEPGTGLTQDILNNATAIGTNATNIGTNVANIGNNLTAIGTNATNIGTSVTNIGNNLTAIGTNATNIGTNVTNIGNNATAIGTNVTNIGTNVTNIGNNATAIGTNVTNIGTNVTNIGNNATAIGTNSTNISNHLSDTTTHGVSGNLVGTSDTQVLTSKTIDFNLNTILNLPAAPGALILAETGTQSITGPITFSNNDIIYKGDNIDDRFFKVVFGNSNVSSVSNFTGQNNFTVNQNFQAGINLTTASREIKKDGVVKIDLDGLTINLNDDILIDSSLGVGANYINCPVDLNLNRGGFNKIILKTASVDITDNLNIINGGKTGGYDADGINFDGTSGFAYINRGGYQEIIMNGTTIDNKKPVVCSSGCQVNTSDLILGSNVDISKGSKLSHLISSKIVCDMTDANGEIDGGFRTRDDDINFGATPSNFSRVSTRLFTTYHDRWIVLTTNSSSNAIHNLGFQTEAGYGYYPYQTQLRRLDTSPISPFIKHMTLISENNKINKAYDGQGGKDFQVNFFHDSLDSETLLGRPNSVQILLGGDGAWSGHELHLYIKFRRQNNNNI